MATTGGARRYDTLEGLRAVGAALVVVRHLGEFFGFARVPESFLAVDLFYLVSGVVMASAYGQRLSTGRLSLKDFCVTRVIRLYPLYLLGIGLGLAAALLDRAHNPASWWTTTRLLEAGGTGLLLIPMLPGLQTSGSALDGPVWTLGPELAANFLWARTIGWARPLVLALALAGGAAGVVWAEAHFKTLDVGWAWAHQGAALARGVFSFFAGVAIFALLRGRSRPALVTPWLCMALLAMILAWPLNWPPLAGARPAYELGCVLVVFPALIATAAVFEPGPRIAAAFATLGRASWGVYILHEPVARLLELTVLKPWRAPHGWAALGVGLGYLLLVNLLALAMDRGFETPIRRALSRAWLPPRNPPASAPAALTSG